MHDPEVTASIDPRWRRLPEERPKQILLSAIDVFAEHGIAGAKLEEIAVRAGVSKGTIYLYFNSKEELFREVVRQLLAPSIAEFEKLMADGTSLDQVERYLRNAWAHLAHSRGAAWLRLVTLELHKYPDLAAFYFEEVIAKSNRALAEVLQRGMDRGEVRRADPAATVSMIKSVLLMQVMWTQSVHPAALSAHFSTEQVIDQIVEFVLQAIRPTAPPAGAHQVSR